MGGSVPEATEEQDGENCHGKSVSHFTSPVKSLLCAGTGGSGHFMPDTGSCGDHRRTLVAQAA
ncbi:hypothetical protein [Photorhabdus bodei]|uniref:hypothetical protein n=1 Tax=Photorhabdus bodei TaxID=2029681 RepID=UPI001EE48537|nr:hypothetical protein [Photorhabdus bodei]